jgi:hypothetical protein
MMTYAENTIQFDQYGFFNDVASNLLDRLYRDLLPCVLHKTVKSPWSTAHYVTTNSHRHPHTQLPCSIPVILMADL